MKGIKTRSLGIIFIILCTLCTSLGVLLIKIGVKDLALTAEGLIKAYPVAIGFVFYFFGFILMTLSFRYGEFSVLYPFISLSFVWVTIMSALFLKEIITGLEMLGIAVIVMGVVSIGMSGRAKSLRLRA